MDTMRCRIGWISRRNQPGKHCGKNNVKDGNRNGNIMTTEKNRSYNNSNGNICL